MALKLIRKTEHWNDARIQHEISIMRGLSHPHIASIFDSIDAKDYCCVVMEFVSNGDLCSLLEKNRGYLTEQVPFDVPVLLLLLVAVDRSRYALCLPVGRW